jgi:hypothetical protein
MKTTSILILSALITSCSALPPKSDRKVASVDMPETIVPIVAYKGAELLERNDVKEFCSFPKINSIFRFVVENKKPKVVTLVQVSKKSRKEVYDYTFVGEKNEGGDMGSFYRVFELKDTDAKMPKYFYYETHPQYTRTKHFFADKVNVATGEPVVSEEVTFQASIDQFGDEFICGYED